MSQKFLVALIATALVATTAQAQPAPPDPASLIPGAWASGEDPDACRTSAISYFLTDGSYVVFERFDGQLHAVGRWRVDGANVFLTHTDAPFPDNGAASQETTLSLRRLDRDVFETANAAGRVRVRTRCAGLVLPPGATSGGQQ